MRKEAKCGWFCDMVEGVRMCVPFELYLDHGFIIKESTPYTELFGHKLYGDIE